MRITRKTYRGTEGYLVSGRTPEGQRVSIFAARRVTAEHIRNQKRAGLQVTLSDWALDAS